MVLRLVYGLFLLSSELAIVHAFTNFGHYRDNKHPDGYRNIQVVRKIQFVDDLDAVDTYKIEITGEDNPAQGVLYNFSDDTWNLTVKVVTFEKNLEISQ